MSPKLLLCLFNRHRPIRKNVGYKGVNLSSTCRNCGRPIIRLRKSYWVLDKSGPDGPADSAA